MTTSNVIIKLLILSFSILISSSVMAMPDQSASAINKAGMQRMLSQRIAKAYFLKGIGENTSLANSQLQESIRIYEHNLKDLSHFVKKNRLETVLPALEKNWKIYKELALSESSKESGKKLLLMSDQMLAKAHELTGQLQVFSGNNAAELINISGRQRMLAQRISKLYMAYCWQIKGEDALEEMMESLSEYEVALEFLRQSPMNSKKIKHNLRKVSGQLKFAQKSFDKLNEGSYLIHVVNSTTDTMLKQMNTITQMYVGVMDSKQNMALAARSH